MILKKSTEELLKTIKGSSVSDLSFMSSISNNELNSKINENSLLQTRNLQLKEDLLIFGEVKKLLIKLKNSKMIDKKDFILTTINTAIRDIFIDQNVRIDIVASNTNQEASKLNIKYDIVLYQNEIKMSENEKMISNNGGGVLSFISILFKILVGYIYSKNKFYVFDESLSEVSEIYLPRMGSFFKKFCEKHGFTIIFITHTPLIVESADLAYMLDGDFEDGVPLLKIDKIIGEYPKENYIYTKIENFQAIKKLEFRYKGFTAIIGKNNIGKSASFRAINSILFNNFSMSEYPRKKSSEHPEKLLASSIEFGFYHSNDDPLNEDTKIRMYKKGSSLIYEFNGQTFVGKNLAFEKVKEKIESIGFRYLNLKEQYKNFKGNLKEQTERLAITTQQDTYYLVGGKTSDTSKVFDFLFDSREVTMAINNLNEDILNREQELNSNIITIEINNKDINFINCKLRYITNIYKSKVIESLISYQHDLHEIEANKFYLEKNLVLVDKALNLALYLYQYQASKINLDLLINQSNKLNKKITLINSILTNYYNIDLINSHRNALSYLKYLNVLHLYKHNQLKILTINFMSTLDYTIKTQKNKILRLHKKIELYYKLSNNIQNIYFIENYNIELENYHLKVRWTQNLNKKINLLQRGLNNLNNMFSLNNIVSNLSSIEKYLNDLKNFKYLKEKNHYLINLKINGLNLKYTIDELLKLHSDKTNLINKSNYLKNELNTLHIKFNLKPCTSCTGLGFHVQH